MDSDPTSPCKLSKAFFVAETESESDIRYPCATLAESAEEMECSHSDLSFAASLRVSRSTIDAYI